MIAPEPGRARRVVRACGRTFGAEGAPRWWEDWRGDPGTRKTWDDIVGVTERRARRARRAANLCLGVLLATALGWLVAAVVVAVTLVTR